MQTAPAPTVEPTPTNEPAPIAAPTATVSPPRTFEMENGALKLPGPIVFQSDRLDASASIAALEHVQAFLEQKADITLLRVEGHTDADGAAAFNQLLSEKRALAVAKWLIDKGVSCDRLYPVGFGKDKPVAANDTPEGKAQNRRIVIAPAMLRGRAIGGMPVDGGGHLAGDPCK